MEASTATPAPTTPVETAEPAAEARSAPQADQGNGEPPAENGDGERDDQGRYLSREAASYRRRLRDTEAERDQLREQLDRLQRAEVERLAAGAGMAKPEDLWTLGTQLEHCLAEDGTVDAETVTGVVADVLKDRPGLQARPVGDLGIGRGGSASITRTGPKVGLSQLLKPGRT